MKNDKKINKEINNKISECNTFQNKSTSSETEDCNFSNLAERTAATIASINIIRNELSKVPLDPSEKNYIEFYILPLLDVISRLALTGYNLSGSAERLYISNIESAKRSKIKDTQKIVYDINQQCEDLYSVLKKRLKILKCK